MASAVREIRKVGRRREAAAERAAIREAQKERERLRALEMEAIRLEDEERERVEEDRRQKAIKIREFEKKQRSFTDFFW